MNTNSFGRFQLRIGTVEFLDGTELTNVDAYLLGEFLMVAEGDGPPTLYPIARISALRKVEEIKKQSVHSSRASRAVFL